MPMALALLLSYLAKKIVSSDPSSSQPEPTNFPELNYSINLVKSNKTYKINSSLAIISNNKTLQNLTSKHYSEIFKGKHNIAFFTNYSNFLNYINNNEYNSSNFSYTKVIEIINEEKGRIFKFKDNNFNFESVLSLENKLSFPDKQVNPLFNPYFLLTSLVEQSLGNIPSQNLTVSQEILKRRPKFNLYTDNTNTCITIAGLLSLCYCLSLFSFFDWIIEEKQNKLNYLLYRQGVSKKVYYFSWFLFYFIINLIPSFFTSLIISSFILYNGIYFYTFLANLFFTLNVFGFCFFFASFIEKVETGQKLIKFIYIGSTIMGLILLGTGISKIIRIVFAILPNINLMLSISIIFLLDNFENGVDWILLTTKNNQISLFDSFIISIISFILYISLGIFFILYNDGYFKKYYSNKELEEEEIGNKVTIDSDVDKSLAQFDIHHENLSDKNQKLLSEKNCLSIKNVYKIYGDFKSSE